ncbi:MAG: hypothetical protein K6L76_13335 [Agarilytica sp.]
MIALIKRAKTFVLLLAAMVLAMLVWKMYVFTSPNSLAYVVEPERFNAQGAQGELQQVKRATELHIVSILDRD